jgi:hypothetical protein
MALPIPVDNPAKVVKRKAIKTGFTIFFSEIL